MNWLRRWYNGKYIPPQPLDEDDCHGVAVANVGHQQRHWTARLAAAAVEFARRHGLAAVLAASTVASAVFAALAHYFPPH